MSKKIKILSIILVPIILILLIVVGNKNTIFKINSKEKLEFNYDNSELQNLTFDKYWEDYNIEQFRPSSSTFNIYDKKDYYNNENKTIIQTVTLTSANADPNDPNHWIGQFTNLPKKYEDGTKVDYVVREVTSEDSPYYVAYDSAQGLAITFNENTDTDRYSALKLYMTKDGVLYNYGYYLGYCLGNELKGVTLYLDLENDDRFVQESSMYLDSLIHNKNISMIQEKVGNDYPETPHPYPMGEHYAFHYQYTPAEHSQKFYLVLRGDSWGNTYGFSFDNITTLGDETIVTSLTNLRNLEVTKKWEDQGYESYRPSEVTYDIYDSKDLNTIVKTVTLNSSNQTDNNTWNLTVDNLKKYDDNGQEIEYTVKERPIENYLSLNDYSEYYNGLLIKFSADSDYNFHICTEKIEKDKYKCLSHYGYQYYSDQNSVDSNGGSYIKDQTIYIPSKDIYILYKYTSDENKKIKIENITPIHYENSEEREQSIETIKIADDYSANIDEYLDANPSELNPNTYVDGYYTNYYEWHYEWKGSFEQKPNSTVVRNTINLTDIPFTKIWNDVGFENKRPSEIKVRIYNEQEPNILVQEITLNSSNQDQTDPYKWNGKFENLPKYNTNGSIAKYIIKEETLEKYKTTYDMTDIKGFMVTMDEQTYARGSYYFGKVDSTNPYKKYLQLMPREYSNLSTTLTKDQGNDIKIYIPYTDEYFNYFYLYFSNTSNSQTEESDYGFKIKEIIPVSEDYSEKTKIYNNTNQIDESRLSSFSGDNFPESTHPFEGYSYYKYTYQPLSNSYVGANIIINTINVKDIEINKQWDDIGQEEYRPNKITFDIYDSNDLNTIVKTVELTNEDKIDNYNWKTTVELPKTKNNQEVQYIFKERPIDNYETTYKSTKEIKGLKINFDIIENTGGAPIYICYKNEQNNNACYYAFSGESVSYEVPTKEFEIVLLNNYAKNVKISNITPIYTNAASYSISNSSMPTSIPRTYATGEEYLNFSSNETTLTQPYIWHYTCDENIHYNDPSIYTDIAVNKSLFKNLEIEKEWIDNGYEVLRPNNLKINVLKNNEIIQEVNLTKDNDYKIAVTLPKYENGNEIEYEIQEENLNNYTTTYRKENNKTIITNEIILKDVIISKLDEEKNNLKGALLSIITETGDEVLEFTTTNSDTTIKLPEGQFILKEKQAPKGYLTAKNISFNISDKITINNEEVEKIEMIDKYQKNPITLDNINNYIKLLFIAITAFILIKMIKINETKNS